MTIFSDLAKLIRDNRQKFENRKNHEILIINLIN